jgi:two-component system sensor histidine kinase KdpD
MQRLRRAADAVREREERTSRLYAMSQEVAVARTGEEIAWIACRHVENAFGGQVALVFVGPERLRAIGVGVGTEVDPASGVAAAVRDLAKGPSGLSSAREAPSGELVVGLRASAGLVAAIVIRPPSRSLGGRQNQELLHTYASQIALALERVRLAEDAQKAQMLIQTERLRNALLSSVSHDLLNPLAVVKGAATALIEDAELPWWRKKEYLETISSEASRLSRLVRNLLSMTSLEAGTLRARKEWQPLEEVVGVALNRLDDQLAAREIEVQIPAEASMVLIDATLLEQVILNLTENALRYSPPGSPIALWVRKVEDGVEVEIADRGPGVPPGQEEEIFEKFKRASPATVSGMGLGLTICRGIIAAHGGRIWCQNRTDGGASFHFVLPREGQEPPIPSLPEETSNP